MAYLIIGFSLKLILAGVMTFKTVIPKKIYLRFLIISCLLGLVGFYIRYHINLKDGCFLLMPLFFLLIYQVLRYIFKLFFGNEPILAGRNQTSWEQGEYRKLHFGDVIFTVFLLLTPIISCFILTSNK